MRQDGASGLQNRVRTHVFQEPCRQHARYNARDPDSERARGSVRASAAKGSRLTHI